MAPAVYLYLSISCGAAYRKARVSSQAEVIACLPAFRWLPAQCSRRAHECMYWRAIHRNDDCAGVDSLSQRLSSMRSFVQQQINTLTAKQVKCAATSK